MKFCTYCGSEMADSANFCPRCGTKASTLSAWDKTKTNDIPNTAWDRPNQNETPNTGWGNTEKTAPKVNEHQKDDAFLWTVISFFLPLVGLILWLIWKDDKPVDAMGAAKGALVSIALGLPIVGFVCFFLMKGFYKSVGNACLISAIIGCCFYVLPIFGLLLGI